MRTLIFIFSLASVTFAADWPQFLGPTRNNIASNDEKPLPDSFPPTGPEVLWEKPLGDGYAGPAMSQGKVVVFHREGSKVKIEALDALTGAALWSSEQPTDYRDSFGMDEGPRATPTISGGRVFAHGADGVLYALDMKSGKKLWQVDTAKDFGSEQGFFGRACAPLVVGDSVVLTPGGAGGKAVAAFSIEDGSLKWAAADDEASYASPVMALDDVMVCWLRNHLTTLNPLNGKVLSREFLRPEIEASVSAATPIQTDRGWFVSAEYDVGASLWDIGADGSLNKTWDSAGTLNCHYATPVYFDGYVYGFDGRQESGMTLRCVSTEKGEVKWESPRVRGGTVMLVKDKLLVVTEDGEAWFVRATADKFDQIATAQVTRAGHRSYPAYANGVLYARDGQKLVAVRIAQ